MAYVESIPVWWATVALVGVHVGQVAAEFGTEPDAVARVAVRPEVERVDDLLVTKLPHHPLVAGEAVRREDDLPTLDGFLVARAGDDADHPPVVVDKLRHGRVGEEFVVRLAAQQVHQFGDEVLAVVSLGCVHPELGVFGVLEVVHEVQRDVPVVDEPVDEVHALLGEVTNHLLVGLVVVLVEDVPDHVRGRLLDALLSL
jgi:hypothetical protein